MKLQEFKLTRNNALLVPRGFAHGFITTEDNTVVQYLVDNVYDKESEGTLFWNEVPELHKKLKGKDLIISSKDNPNEVIH
jgi:dTDP-4-dehydrorhamnose 3,5-epimerase